MGLSVAVGVVVRLSVTVAFVRCVLSSLPQVDLPAEASVLRTAARLYRVVCGDYCVLY